MTLRDDDFEGDICCHKGGADISYTYDRVVGYGDGVVVPGEELDVTEAGQLLSLEIDRDLLRPLDDDTTITLVVERVLDGSDETVDNSVQVSMGRSG